MELIDTQADDMDARKRHALRGFVERKKVDCRRLVKAATQGMYTAAVEWFSKLLNWKLDMPVSMQ